MEFVDAERIAKGPAESRSRLSAGLGAELEKNMDRTAIAARYTKAGKNGLMLEFAALCQEAKTKPELVAVVETLDAEFHGERIGHDWVDWHEVNRLIARRIFAYDFGDGPDFEDGHDSEGFKGGCERMGCEGGDKCTAKVPNA